MAEFPYPYPVSNSDLKRHHDLQPHPEGGFFRETLLLQSEPGAPLSLPAPAADLKASELMGGTRWIARGSGALLPEFDAKDSGQRGQSSVTCTSTGDAIVSQIYYLLEPSSPIGYLHVNLHAHFMLHHAGRSLYTFIKPPTSASSSSPEIHRIVMGPDPARGEVTQLFVPGGWYKTSEIPEEDLLLLDSAYNHGLEERIGALITEVVVPAWIPQQCKIVDRDDLRQLWGEQQGWEEYLRYVKPEPESS